MKKDANMFLDHIRDSIAVIEDAIKGKSFEEFVNSIVTQDCVVRRIEIIGEAANNLPEDFQKEHPEIAWRKIVGMRNILAHEYFGVDLKVVWDTAVNKIPVLKEELSKLKYE
ncbi:MAG TPA: DUF86 domain-containing protein [Candidatus Paceibacterota bacterium]